MKGFLRDAIDHTLEIKAAGGDDINPDKGTAQGSRRTTGFADEYAELH